MKNSQLVRDLLRRGRRRKMTIHVRSRGRNRTTVIILMSRRISFGLIKSIRNLRISHDSF
jgi:hypothetical protein